MPNLIPKFAKRTPRVKSVVLFSGGLDSLVCLYWAKSLGKTMAVGFDYGQMHDSELDAAWDIAHEMRVPFEVLSVPVLGKLSEGALTNPGKKVWNKNGSMNETLFVPGRNLVFLSLAAGLAITHGATDLVVGEGQSDADPFPDATEQFFKKMGGALSAGIGVPFKIHTPLMGKTKGQGIKIGLKYKGFEKMMAKSISCYRGTRPPCQDCPACELRATGFSEAGIPDPALV